MGEKFEVSDFLWCGFGVGKSGSSVDPDTGGDALRRGVRGDKGVPFVEVVRSVEWFRVTH